MNATLKELYDLRSRLRYFQKMAIKEPNLMDWGSCITETLTKIKDLTNGRAN